MVKINRSERVGLFARTKREAAVGREETAASQSRLRTQKITTWVSIAAVAVIVILFRQRIVHFWLLFTASVGKWVVHFAQGHPHTARLLAVFLNLVPDTEFLVLALAGLVYLMPSFIKRIEENKTIRGSVTVFLLVFAVVTVVVNATNRERDQYTNDNLNHIIRQQGKQLTAVNDTDGQILDHLTKSPPMTEADRRENIEKILRNKYIRTHNNLDPEILAGNRMPPDDWMNAQLQLLGEKWTFASPPKPLPGVPPMQKAAIEVGFYNPDMAQRPIQKVQFASVANGEATFSIGAIARGSVPAKDVMIWIRRCTQCEWVGSPPPGFAQDADHPYDWGIAIPEMLPNVASNRWNFSVKIPGFPKAGIVGIGVYYACDNCAIVDWHKPRLLIVTNTLKGYLQYALPSISTAPVKTYSGR